MTTPGQATWIRTVFAMASCLLLLSSVVATASADPREGPTALTVAANVAAGFQVTATGTLTDRDGTPIPNATVGGWINGQQLGQSTTNADGAYALTFTLPETLRSDPLALLAYFAGAGASESSQALVTITPSEPSSPEAASGQPAGTLIAVALNTTIAPTTLPPGGLVTVEGSITDAEGNPIAGALINVLIDGQESTDSRTISSDSGAFQTFAEIAPDQATGAAIVEVSFAGNTAYAASVQPFDLTIDAPIAADESDANASPEPNPEPTTTSEATPDVTGAAAATDDVTVEATLDKNPLSWFYVALIVVGGISALFAAGLLFRAAYSRRSVVSADENSLSLLLDTESVSDDEMMFGQEPNTEIEAPHVVEESVEDQGPAARRRAAPPESH